MATETVSTETLKAKFIEVFPTFSAVRQAEFIELLATLLGPNGKEIIEQEAQRIIANRGVQS